MSKTIFTNKYLRVLLLTNSVILLSGAMLGPIYALFVEKVGGSLMDAAVAGGVYSLMAAMVTLVSGKFADKIKRKKIIIALGYFIMGAGFLSYLWVNSVWSLFVVQAIIGFGEAIYAPVFDSLYSKHINWGKGGSQWGTWESTRYLTASLGAFIGGALVTLVGFNSLFITMTLLCASSAVYILFLNKGKL